MDEKIRDILRKIIFPIRDKKNAVANKLRLSILFRIAYSYGRILFVEGIIIMLIFSFAFLQVSEREYANNIDSIVSNLEDNPETLVAEINEPSIYIKGSNVNEYQAVNGESELGHYADYLKKRSINPYIEKGLNMQIKRKSDSIILYSDIEKNVSEEMNFLGIAHLSNKDKNLIFIIGENRYAKINDNDFEIYFQIDFSREMRIFKSLTWMMVLITLILTIILTKGGERTIMPIFAPIKQMANAANRLTVNNLNSQRFNIEGTKNELKDLAETFNNMLDRLEVSYESQKQFVSDASHELRTPIAVIQGYVNMLDRWGKTDEAILEESIEAIKREASSMQDMVEKLLFLSRHDKKTLKLDKKMTDMKPVIEEMIKETRLVAKDRNIGYERLEKASLYADKQSIKQALRILIDNAIKYSDIGATINISCYTDSNDNCVLCVADTGFGMTREDAENMFKRFYRSDNVRNKKISGNGLGLSLAKLIVLKHTGTIKVRTQFDKGTNFTLIFPPVLW